MSTDKNNSYHIFRYWLATSQGGRGGGGGTSTSPEGENISYGLELENLDKVIEILNQKEKISEQQRDELTVVLGDSNFLPSSTLLVGARLSLAVCRIMKNFSLSDFTLTVKNIPKNLNNELNLRKTLQEIFSIPEQLANEIFKTENYVEDLQKISQKQLDELNPIPWGTGFLVGGTHLLTNHHVIPTVEIAAKCIAQFNRLERTPDSADTSYEFDPKTLFVTNPDLDYTLLQLKSDNFASQAGYRFGWIQLLENDANIAPGLSYLKSDQNIISLDNTDNELISVISKKLNNAEIHVIWHSEKLNSEINDAIKTQAIENIKELSCTAEGIFQQVEADIMAGSASGRNVVEGDPVIIVQYPKGREQKIVLYDNRIINNGLLKDFLRYRADSDYGSSGSPVFNTKWELIALHHAAIPNIIEPNEKDKIIAQQGIRICRIIEDLKKKSFSDRKLRNFIEDFVITSEQLNNPPLPSALELDGLTNYVVLKNGNTNNRSETLQGFELEVIVCPYSYKLEGTIFSKFYQNFNQNGIATLGYDSIRVYITKEGTIAFSRKMCTLPTLPLELPQGITQLREFIVNLKSILKILGYDGIRTKQELQKFLELKKEINFDINAKTFDLNPQILNALNSEITFLGLYELDYNAIEQQSEGKQDSTIGISKNPSSGEIVKGLQNILNTLGYYHGQLDGKYNEETYDAVKRFQKDCGLKQDGVCGSLTQKMLSQIYSYEFETEEKVKFGEFSKIKVVCQRENQDLKIYINDKECKLQSEQKSSAQDDKPQKTSEQQNISELQVTSRKAEKNIDITQGTPIIIGAYSHKNFSIYRFPYPGNLWSFFRGAIAQVSLYKIDNQHQRKLVANWQFEEGKGNRVNQIIFEEQSEDKIPFLRIYGEPKWLRPSNFPAPLLPSALKLDSPNSYVDCGYNQSLDVTDAITVEAWFKHSFGNCEIVSGMDEQNNGYSLSYRNGKIWVILQQYQNVAEKIEISTREDLPQDQLWHHIAFTWSQNSQEQDEKYRGIILIYIDGKIQDCLVEGKSKSIIVAGKAKNIGLFTSPALKLTKSLTIGRNLEKEAYYSVAIADVRLWQIARTQDEIQANMSRRLTGKEENLLGYWRLDNDQDVRNLVNDTLGNIFGDVTCFPSPVTSLPNTANPAI